MQVDIVADGVADSHVFDEPVRELILTRTADRGGRPCWQAEGNSIAAKHIPDVKRLADVTGTFATAKQRRAQHSHRG